MNRKETIDALKTRADDVSQSAAATLDLDGQTLVLLHEAFTRMASLMLTIVERMRTKEGYDRELVLELAMGGKLCAQMAIAIEGGDKAGDKA